MNGPPEDPAGVDAPAGTAAFRVDPDPGRAETPPGWLYTDPRVYALLRERVFARSWQWIGDARELRAPGHVRPLVLLEGCLDEPLLLSRDARGLHCLSNVCTHRGALVVEGEGHLRTLRCRYHGRRFALDGRFRSMPEFDGVEGFPSPSDDLPRLPLENWGPFLFTSLDPAMPFSEWIEPLRSRVSFLSLSDLVFDRQGFREYRMDANWALYVDNYVEEFHIPHVHGESLGDVLDYGTYRTELFRWGSLQLGIAPEGTPAFELPDDHPDRGSRIGAFYFWLFPNSMWNFYPWGLSVNVVRPQGVDLTRVAFYPFVLDAAKREEGAGRDLHRVEMEDEEVVESVQRGVRSRLYRRGRYSARRERGAHHFHRLLAESLDVPGPAGDAR